MEKESIWKEIYYHSHTVNMTMVTFLFLRILLQYDI